MLAHELSLLVFRGRALDKQGGPRTFPNTSRTLTIFSHGGKHGSIDGESRSGCGTLSWATVSFGFALPCQLEHIFHLLKRFKADRFNYWTYFLLFSWFSQMEAIGACASLLFALFSNPFMTGLGARDWADTS